MTGFSSFIWGKFWFLRAVQFPWRLLGLTASLQIVCALGLYTLNHNKVRINAIITLFLIFATFYHWQMFFPNQQVKFFPDTLEFKWKNIRHTKTTLSFGEFMPKSVKNYGKLPPRGYSSINSIMLFEPDVHYDQIG